MKKSSLALIVPCYNEAEAIAYFAEELAVFLQKFALACPNDSIQILIVNNNSTDASGDLLQGVVSRFENLKIEFCGTQGYGAALKQGFATAQAEYLAFLDLDNTYPLESLITLFQKVRVEELDIVYGARIHAASRISPVRELGNRLYVSLLRFLIKARLSDVCSGMRVFRATRKPEILALKSNSLSFSIEFSAHAVMNAWRIGEHPIAYRERVGESKLSVVKDGFGFLKIVLLKYLQGPKK